MATVQRHRLIYRQHQRLTVRRVLRSLLFSLFLILHPNDSFWDLKYERRGNVPAASIILGFVVFTYVFMRQSMGFIFNPVDLSKLNILTEIASVLVPFFLWCTVSWSLTTLMSGKGSFGDIYVASAFALMPLIIVNIPVTIVSNVLILEEGPFLTVLVAVAVVWTGILLFVGTMVTHEYDATKTFFTCILVVAGMTAVLFLAILFFSLLNQAFVFANSIYREMLFR